MASIVVETERLRCLAVLTNVDASCLGLTAPLGLSVSRWTAEKAIPIISKLEFLAEHEVDVRLKGRYHAIDQLYSVYVLEGEVILPSTDHDTERRDAEQSIVQRVHDEVALWRLLKDSSVHVASIYLYRHIGDEMEFTFSESSIWFPEQSVLTLSSSDLDRLAQIRQALTFPFSQPYLELARRNFEQSFQIGDPKLKLLVLMIGLEAIFNDGPTEIAYRVSRGVAVVLSRSQEEGHELFKEAKRFYALRSKLVHSGDVAVELEQVARLRSLLRQSLLVLARAMCSKEVLLRNVAAAGYGGWPAT